jgi:hypothetical protein
MSSMRRNADPIADMLSGAAFRAAAAAQKIGVFEAVRDGPLTDAQLAQRLHADERGMHILLAMLEHFGYVARDDRGYTASIDSALLEFWGTTLFGLWKDLEDSILYGGPVLDFYPWLEQHPETLRNFHTMLRMIAREVAAEVVESVELPPDARRLLDIGGSHAEYSAAFCRRHPELSATVFDFAGALEAGRENAASMGGRISLQPGNFLTDDLGGGYDVVLLMSVVHGHEAEANIELLRRVAAALSERGQVIILEQLTDADDFNRMFSLNLFHLQGGQTYSFEEIAGWLAAAGFRNPRQIALPRSKGDTVIVADRG